MLPRPLPHPPERPADGRRPHSVLGTRPPLPADRTDIQRAGRALAPRVDEGELEVCTLVLRLDGLAALRERHGEAVGTHVCTELIRRLLRCTRAQDVAARCPSDDAVLLLLLPCPPADAEALAHQLADRARVEVSRPVQYRTLSLRVGCSVGRARWQRGGTLEAAIEQAREAVHLADQPRMPAVPARLALAALPAEIAADED